MTRQPPQNTRLSASRPYPGLRPFDFADSAFFFGRDEQIFALYRLLDVSRFVAVIGSSGSGKSSLVRAGLRRLLHDETAGRGGRVWRVAEPIRPGDDPLERLAESIAGLAPSSSGADDHDEAGVRRDRIALALEESSFGIENALDEIPDLGDDSILLIVDQFEELFRYSRAGDDTIGTAMWREEAASFVQLLLEASRSRKHAISVLITMRSDFIGDCSQFLGLPEAVSASQFLVPSLTRDQREEVVRKPLVLADGTIDPILVQRLLNDVDQELDQLPVLQHTLMRLWDVVQPSKHISVAAYESQRIGGAEHALSNHADEVMSTLPGRELAVEQVFRALSERDKEGRATRRARSLAQLQAETGCPMEDVVEVVERFRQDDCSFITPPTSETEMLDDETRIDVSHESLLRRWTRISSDAEDVDGTPIGWLAKEEMDGRHYRALLALAQTSRAGERGVTLPIDQVAAHHAWWKERTRTPAWAERYGGHYERVEELFRDSLAAMKADAEEKEVRRIERETEAANRARLERETLEKEAAYARRQTRQTRRFATVFGVLALLSIVFMALAIANWYRTQQLVNIQRAEGLSYLSAKQGSDTRLAGVLATEAFSAGSTPVTKGALLSELTSIEGLHKLAMPAWSAGTLADHDRALAVLTGPFKSDRAVKQGALYVLDAESLDVHAIHPNVRANLLCGFADGPQIAVVDGTTIASYDVSGTQAAMTTVDAPHDVGPVSAMACLDGRKVALAKPSEIDLFDLASGTSTRLAAIAGATGLKASDGHTMLATISRNGHLISIFSLRNRSAVGSISVASPAENCAVYSCASLVAFNQDGSRFAWFELQPEPVVLSVAIARLRQDPTPDLTGAVPTSVTQCLWPHEMQREARFLQQYIAELRGTPAERARARELQALMRRVLRVKDMNPVLVYRDAKLPQVVIPRSGSIIYNASERKYDSYGSCRATGNGPLPFPIPALTEYVNPEADGLTTRGPTGYNYPMLGGVGVTNSSNYAMIGHDIIMPLNGPSLHVGHLDHWRKNADFYGGNEPANVDIFDAEDGGDAVEVQATTGDVRLVNLTASPSPTAVATTTINPNDLHLSEDRKYWDAQAGYDSESKTLRVATISGVIEYDAITSSSGTTLRRRDARTWKSLLAGLPRDATSVLERVSLSARGRFVDYFAPDTNVYIIDLQATRRPTEFSTVSAVRDERFLFGKKSDDDTRLGIFSLPTMEQMPGLTLDGDGPAAISPDGQTIAFVRDDSVTLFDRISRREIGQLPKPSDLGAYLRIRFSADNRYLAVAYSDNTPAKTYTLALYDIDPGNWERYLCRATQRYRDDARVVADIDPQWRFKGACDQKYDAPATSSPSPVPRTSTPPTSLIR